LAQVSSSVGESVGCGLRDFDATRQLRRKRSFSAIAATVPNVAHRKRHPLPGFGGRFRLARS